MRITKLNKRSLYGSVIKDFPVALTTGTPRERIDEKQTNNQTIKQTNKQKKQTEKKKFPRSHLREGGDSSNFLGPGFTNGMLAT